MDYKKVKLGDNNDIPQSIWSTDDNIICEDNRSLRDNLNDKLDNVTIKVNGTTYTHVDGVITLPDYPSNSGGTTDEMILTSSNGYKFKIIVTDTGTLKTELLSEGTDDPYISNRILIFEDKFNADALNTSNWRYELGNVRNSELQYYSQESVSVSNDNLVISATRFPEGIAGKYWKSGSITTQGKQAFLYGRYEAKMKVPNNTAGSFPAFWTLSDRFVTDYSGDYADETLGVIYPDSGEIDIMEQKGTATGITAGVYYNNNGTTGSLCRIPNYELDLTQWHIYAMEWTENRIDIYVDGVLIIGTDITPDMRYYHEPQYMILNLALGASAGTPEDSVNNMEVLVDWVRVYAPTTFSSIEEIRSIQIEEVSEIGVDESRILKYTISPDNVGNRALVWTSDNEAVCTVHGGVLKGKTAGTANITVTTANGISSTRNIEVKENYTSYWNITTNLQKASIDNKDSTVGANSSYTCTITPNNGYTLDTVTVTMGGADITSTVYSNGNINIPNVTGDIVITVTTNAIQTSFRPVGNCPEGYVEVDLSTATDTISLRNGLSNAVQGVTYFEIRAIKGVVKSVTDVKYPSEFTSFTDWNGSDLPQSANVVTPLAYATNLVFTLGLDSNAVGTTLQEIKEYMRNNKYIFYVKYVAF